MPLYRAGGLHLLHLRRQGLAAVPALLRQGGPNLVDSFGWYQRPMRSTMAGLSTRLPPALLSPARWRGSPASPLEEGGLDEFVEFCLRSASCPLQVGDLLLGIRDPLLPLRDLSAAVHFPVIDRSPADRGAAHSSTIQ